MDNITVTPEISKDEKNRLEMERDSIMKRIILYEKNVYDLEIKVKEILEKLKDSYE